MRYNSGNIFLASVFVFLKDRFFFTTNFAHSLLLQAFKPFVTPSEEAVNLRLPIELNDWLNDLLKNGKRKHGSKIPKEIWVQAALELFQVMPVDWESIEDEEQLQATLKNLESILKNLVL